MEVIPEDFIRNIDNRLIDEDVGLHQRPFVIVMEWMDQNNISGNFLDERIWVPLMASYKKLYPTGDFSVPALSSAGVAIRDKMYPVHVGIGFGTVEVDPLKLIDISTEELSYIFNNQPEQGWKALYGVCDLWDFAYGVDDLKRDKSPAAELLSNARSAISATARTLLGQTDIDSAIQSACLAAELSLKGALTILGVSAQQIRAASHNLVKLAEILISLKPNGNSSLLLEASKDFPNYVSTRYSSHGLKRTELMALAMRSQFVAAEAVRCVSERNFASQVDNGANPPRPKP